jgi:hypothetical protein
MSRPGAVRDVEDEHLHRVPHQTPQHRGPRQIMQEVFGSIDDDLYNLDEKIFSK